MGEYCTTETADRFLADAGIGRWTIERPAGAEPRLFADDELQRLLAVGDFSSLTPESVYRTWFGRVHPDYAGLVREFLEKVAAGVRTEVTYPWQHPTRGVIWVRCMGPTNSSGKPSTRVEGLHQVISDCVRLQLKSAEGGREQRASAEKEAFVSGITKTLFGYDMRVDLETMRYTVIPGSGMENSVAFLSKTDDYHVAYERKLLHSPSHRDELERCLSPENLRTVARNGHSGLYRTLKYPVRLMNGFSGWEEMAVFIDTGYDGHPQCNVLVRDITEQQRWVDARLQAEREVNAAKSYFFSTVSHDIRTPLNAIIGFSELLEAGVSDEAERARYLSSIRSSSRVLMDLINDVLDLSKLEAGKMEIVPEPTDLGATVEEIRMAFAPEMARKGLAFRSELGTLSRLELDPQRIRQVLFNLVGNAVKFTEKGFVALRVRQTRVQEPGLCALEVEVADTGCGIAPEDQPKLMQPFSQVHGRGRHGGTGLGLAICRQLARRMGGELHLRSAPGEGSVFTLALPCVRLAAAPAEAPVAAPVATAPQTAKRVLVVDDSKVNLAVLKALLARLGCKDVETAEDGKEALARLGADAAFDLVLTDLWMPEMDGEALVRAIRADPRLAHLPVYAVTADVEARKDYASLGFTGLLLKPLTLATLATALA